MVPRNIKTGRSSITTFKPKLLSNCIHIFRDKLPWKWHRAILRSCPKPEYTSTLLLRTAIADPLHPICVTLLAQESCVLLDGDYTHDLPAPR